MVSDTAALVEASRSATRQALRATINVSTPLQVCAMVTRAWPRTIMTRSPTPARSACATRQTGAAGAPRLASAPAVRHREPPTVRAAPAPQTVGIHPRALRRLMVCGPTTAPVQPRAAVAHNLAPVPIQHQRTAVHRASALRLRRATQVRARLYRSMEAGALSVHVRPRVVAELRRVPARARRLRTEVQSAAVRHRRRATPKRVVIVLAVRQRQPVKRSTVRHQRDRLSH